VDSPLLSAFAGIPRRKMQRKVFTEAR